jgi:hypothetical protein
MGLISPILVTLQVLDSKDLDLGESVMSLSRQLPPF